MPFEKQLPLCLACCANHVIVGIVTILAVFAPWFLVLICVLIFSISSCLLVKG